MIYLYKNGEIIRSWSNMRGLRDYIGKYTAVRLSIDDFNIIHGNNTDSELTISFQTGESCTVPWRDKRVLRASLAHWRSLYGLPLFINGECVGELSSHNEKLNEHGYFNCFCHARKK